MSESKYPFNFIIVFFIVFASFGLYWLTRLEISAGDAYLMLMFIGIITLSVAIIAKYIAKLDFWFEIPLNKTAEGGFLSLLLGIVILFVFRLIGTLTSFNLTTPANTAPLASFGTGIGAQTFAALNAATSPFWIFFIVVISAAVIEEIVLGFCFVKGGSLMGYGMRKMLKLDFGSSGGEHSGNYIWDFIWAMIFSMIAFAVLHFFNSTYLDPTTGKMIWGMFLWAAGFRLILNIMIYKFGNLGLLFSIGVHAVNNALYLGGALVFAALITVPGGIIIDAVLALLLYFGVTSIPLLLKEGNLLRKDFMTFD